MRWPKLTGRKAQVLPMTYVCLCARTYPPTSLIFLFKMWWKTIFCAKDIYCHSKERWQSLESLVIWDQCCQLALRTKLPDCYTARTVYFLRTEKLLYEIQRQGQNPRAFIQSHIIPHCLDMNTFSKMFERHCQERSLLYVILKLLAYFASFCCLHKSLLLQHVSCKHVQTMP